METPGWVFCPEQTEKKDTQSNEEPGVAQAFLHGQLASPRLGSHVTVKPLSYVGGPWGCPFCGKIYAFFPPNSCWQKGHGDGQVWALKSVKSGLKPWPLSLPKFCNFYQIT